MARKGKETAGHIRANVLALRRRRRLVEIYFAASLGLVAVMLFAYTHLVISRLRHEFRVTSNAYATIQTLLASDLTDPAMDDVILQLAVEIGRTMKFPSIVTDADGRPMAWSKSYDDEGLGANPTTAEEKIKEEARKLDRDHRPLPITRYARDPLTGEFGGGRFGTFHYAEPLSIKLLYWVPILELGLIVGFVAAGVLAYRRLKVAEQQVLWAGMARETAHQLGTPITSLIGWLEHCRERAAAYPDMAEPLNEMGEDITRLEKVAARFQEIGVPVKPVRGDLVPLIERAVAYGRRRAPARARISFEAKTPAHLYVPHSPVLIEWVVENFVKNAVDATKELAAGKGRIVVEAREEGSFAVVAVTDNGVGIDPAEIKLIFTPGYTTKDKGWGLGLSLVKRIVEDVHGGRLDVWSEMGAGATFSAYLPRDPRAHSGG